MIKVDDQLILRLESLARLHLSDSERDSLKTDLESVLQMVEKLAEVNTQGVNPLLHVLDGHGSLRRDELSGQLSDEEALSNAPVLEYPYFKVPKVIDRS